jgi:hypothetical protein
MVSDFFYLPNQWGYIEVDDNFLFNVCAMSVNDWKSFGP